MSIKDMVVQVLFITILVLNFTPKDHEFFIIELGGCGTSPLGGGIFILA